jgi:translation elongation factor EF-Tu-like GTPase
LCKKNTQILNRQIIKIKARLTLYSTKNGGRKTGIRSGYRPNHVFEYDNGRFKQTYIGQIIFDQQEWIMPGETANVDIEFINMLDIERFINVGRKWWIHEADHKLGESEIIEIIK